MKTHSTFPYLFLAVLLTLQSHAQLALVRQGRESAGTMEPGDWHGAAVATGDFNGDGYDDLATGAPQEKTASDLFSSGIVVVNFGSPFGVTEIGARTLTVIDGSLEADERHQMGAALAVGNFNGDLYDDLAVGLPASTVNGATGAGRVLVYYGGSDGLPGVASVIHQGLVGAAPEEGDLFGSALAAGRLGDDGFDDLAVGAPGENEHRGAVTVIRGGALGLDLSQRQTVFGDDLGFPNQPGDQFGDAVAVGNIAGTPSGELIVGAPFGEVTQGVLSSGLVYIANSSDGAVATMGTVVISPVNFGDTLFVAGHFGAALTVGNFWGDGGPVDLAIGAPDAHAGGRVYIGRGGGLGMTWPTILSQPAGWGADDADDDFGHALAAGDFDADGDDEVIVGCPGQDIVLAFTDGSGSVHIFDGGAAGPTTAVATSYTDFNVGDQVTGEGRMGYAVATGRTSASQRHSVLVGAPRKHRDTGQVFDIAPWRQVLNLDCLSALSVDCEGNVIYALRPFEPVRTASTAKAMTVLLACESGVDNNELYEIPDWLADAFAASGASKMSWTAGEIITFETLMRTAMMKSAGDSCYAIADVMTTVDPNPDGGGFDMYDSAQEFVDLMNARAAMIGMDDTLFTNPRGTDKGGPVTPGTAASTAYDMYLLSREVMKNAKFAGFANTQSTTFARCVGEPGAFFCASNTVSNSWLTSMKGLDPRFLGIKPGRKGGDSVSGDTAIGAARTSTTGELAFANGFAWPYKHPAGKQQLNALMQLAIGSCDPDFQMPDDRAVADSHVPLELDEPDLPHTVYLDPDADVRGDETLVVELRGSCAGIDPLAVFDMVIRHQVRIAIDEGDLIAFAASGDGTVEHFFIVETAEGRVPSGVDLNYTVLGGKTQRATLDAISPRLSIPPFDVPGAASTDTEIVSLSLSGGLLPGFVSIEYAIRYSITAKDLDDCLEARLIRLIPGADNVVSISVSPSHSTPAGSLALVVRRPTVDPAARLTPIISPFAPEPIRYGNALAFAPVVVGDVPGRFQFDLANGTVPDAGNHPVSGRFEPDDPFRYARADFAFSQVVIPAPLTIVADDKRRLEGQANPPLTVSFAGFVRGDLPADLDRLPSIATTAATSSSPRRYPIVVSDARDANYSIEFVDGLLHVFSLDPGDPAPGETTIQRRPSGEIEIAWFGEEELKLMCSQDLKTWEPADEFAIDIREDGLERYRIQTLKDDRAFYRLISDAPPR